MWKSAAWTAGLTLALFGIVRAESDFRRVSPAPARTLSAGPPEEVIAEMNRLVAAYPRICAKRVYGKSLNGVELSALKISDHVDQDEPEPEILFDGASMETNR